MTNSSHTETWFFIVDMSVTPNREWGGGYAYHCSAVARQAGASLSAYAAAAAKENGWCGLGEGIKYGSLRAAKQCPAWRYFKHVPHIAIVERTYEVVGVRLHEFSSVKVEQS